MIDDQAGDETAERRHTGTAPARHELVFPRPDPLRIATFLRPNNPVRVWAAIPTGQYCEKSAPAPQHLTQEIYSQHPCPSLDESVES